MSWWVPTVRVDTCIVTGPGDEPPFEPDPMRGPLELPPSWNVTVAPEGAGEAVRVTACPEVDGFGELVRVKGWKGFTVWVTILEQIGGRVVPPTAGFG
jgi:hypothetical protein